MEKVHIFALELELRYKLQLGSLAVWPMVMKTSVSIIYSLSFPKKWIYILMMDHTILALFSTVFLSVG